MTQPGCKIKLNQNERALLLQTLSTAVPTTGDNIRRATFSLLLRELRAMCVNLKYPEKCLQGEMTEPSEPGRAS